METLDNDYNYIEPSTVSPWPTSLRYGGIAGFILVITGLVMYLTGMSESAAKGGSSLLNNIITYGTWIGAVVLAVKYHRDNELGGFVSFGRAFGVGFFTSLIMGIIGAVWTYIFFSFIGTDLLDVIKDTAMSQMTEEQAEASEGMMDAMMSPGAMSGMMIGGTLIIGAILSLIVGAIMKKDNPRNAA